MTAVSHDARAPRCVRVNQPDQPSALAAFHDPTLIAKKGRLFVLCTNGTPPDLLAQLYERYYADPSCDIVPVLQRTLSALTAEQPEARLLIPLAVVLEGLNVSAVGTPDAALWVDRFGTARQLLPAGRESRPLAPQSPAEAPHLAATYRLSAGDVLIMTMDAALHAQVQRGWGGLGRGAVAHSAQTLARRLGHHTPLTLIGIPGFAPVADLGPVGKVPSASPAATAPASGGRHSPVWPALAVAILTVAIVFGIRRPTLSRDSLLHLFDWALTPVPTGSVVPRGTPPGQTRTMVVLPTATPAPETPTATSRLVAAQTQAPTATPTLVRYPAPELLFPREREELTELSTTLRWAWAGSLAADEWFDVRMWREGTPKTSIAWTKERSYLERYLRPGWYHWTVTVVRAQGRAVLAELCDEPTPVSYLVLGAGVAPSTATPTPLPSPTQQPVPTRVTPVLQPTRAAGGN